MPKNRYRQGGRNQRRSFWVEDKALEFVNPYNFVSLSDRSVTRAPAQSDDGDLTGVIRCTLTTRTPLSIPDASDLTQRQREGNEHKCGSNPNVGVPFFRAPQNGDEDDVPAIPGSELRGVIRNAFEALDNGCLSVNNSNVASARSTFPKKPAVLEGKWIKGEDGKLVWELALFNADKSDHDSGDGVQRVWFTMLHRQGQKKTSWFVKRGTSLPFSTSQIERALEDYQFILEQYKKNDDHFNKELEANPAGITVIPKDPPRFDSTTPGKVWSWPVFYLVEGTGKSSILYLSPAQIGRTVFQNRVDDLLGDHKRCSDTGNLCEPCRLFGMVGDEAQIATRLRFSDALMKPVKDGYESRMLPNITLKELSSPKPSSVEFYTKRPVSTAGEVALTWTYDTATYGYFSDGNKQDRPNSQLHAPAYPLEVRGRKFYLHHWTGKTGEAVDNVILHSCCTDEKTKRNMTTELVKSNTEFVFSVYFDRFTKEQLQKLVWTLCIGENDSSGKQLHKLGHGKPLGLGSAKIHVDSVWTRDAGDGYAMHPEALGELLATVPFVQDKAYDDFLAITNYELTEGLLISYPRADDCGNKANSKASHQWFIANRSVGDGAENAMTPSVYRTLPIIPINASGRAALVLPGYRRNGSYRQTYKLHDDEWWAEGPREKGVILSAHYSDRSNSWHGLVKRDDAKRLFFHTSQSPKLDLVGKKLFNGMEVSFLIGENTDPKHLGQPCAVDLRIIE